MEAEWARNHGHNNDVPIAIIGLAFEFPQGATSVESFWEMIIEGRSASTEFPSDRLNINAFYHPDENRPSSIPLRGGHFIKENLGAFDAPFFSITPDEAGCMDPQHRRMLETTYHALEDSGIPINKCSGSNTSVYTGCFTNDYLSILQQDYDAEQRHAAMGIAPSMLANRLSWFFNFKGTSMNLDTACSSSLIALHLACQNLRAGGSEMAIVGGANLVYHPNFMKIMSDFNFLSQDSRCWSFGRKANGYARGEGIAAIVLKRLDSALEDGNTIRAVIRNTGSNQDGRTPGITQPSQEAQIDLIRQVYRQANVDMEPTRFFEAHATGTPVGDPVEGNAIGAAFRECRSESDPLYIGAIKANIGHLEGCSGLAGVIKATLVLERGMIPPIAGFESLNDRIDAKSLHLHFPTEALPWPPAMVRRACVNSFGFGGTNAVAILDDAYHYLKLNNINGFHQTRLSASVKGISVSPSTYHVQINNSVHDGQSAVNGEGNRITNGINGYTNAKSMQHVTSDIPPAHTKELKIRDEHGSEAEAHAYTKTFQAALVDSTGANGKVMNGLISPTCETTPPRLLIWSASDQQGAQKLSDAYIHYIASQTPKLDDLAYTLTVKRSHFRWRNFAVVDSRNGVPIMSDTPSAPVKAAISNGGIAFVFTGQGAQYLGMGRQLLAFPVFRDSLSKFDDCLKQLGCHWSLLEIMTGKSDLEIDRPEYSQPLTTCLQLALVVLLQSFDIVPSLVLGHSSGEIAAAYTAGALSQLSAIKVAYYRGLLSSQLTGQADGLTMMAVGLSRENVIPYLEQLQEAETVLNVAIGCVNSPKNVTLTGSASQLSTLETWLKEKGIFARKLRVSIAYHSCFMNAIVNDYSKAIEGLEMGQSSGFVPMISSVTGDIVTASTLASTEYWVRNLTSTVEFEAAFGRFLAQANRKPRKQLGKRVAVSNFAVSHVLEIGPHSTLQGPIREILQAFDGTKKPSYIASLNRNQDACFALLDAVGALYCGGYPVSLLRTNGIDNLPRPAPANMPRYPFNHSQLYWKEGQLSRNFRFREKARHDLLGTRSLDWNPFMAQWRNVMRLDELPWLKDHTIGGEIVFPASGMIVMAVEGLRELFGRCASLRGINIQNAAFSHAISFPRGVERVETQLNLIRSSHSSDLSTWSQFRLFVLENGSYIECCSGLIRAVVDSQDRDRVTSSGPWKEAGTPESWIACIDQACEGPARDPYDVPAGTAVRYGPVFRNLEHMRLSTQGEAIALLNTETCRLKTSGLLAPSFVVHPATLDGLAQPLQQALLAQEREDLPTMVPVRVASIWIDCSGNTLNEGKLNVAARCSFRSYRGGSADVVATAIGCSSPIIFFNGLETTFISSTELTKLRHTAGPRFLCTKLVWKPDLDTMTHEQVFCYCIRDRPKQAVNAVQDYHLLIVAVLCFVLDTIAFVDEHPDMKLPRHLEAYTGWMRYQKERLRNGESMVEQQSVQQVLNDCKVRERLISQIENSGVDGFFFMQIGRNNIKMLRGEIDPLAFMFHDGLADKYYEKMLGNDHHAFPASQYIELLSFKNPSMNILEVGAGTGGQTMRLLDAMSSDGVKKWGKYYYTDISPSFFSQARKKFLKYVDKMYFKVCDISKDPVSQSFEAGTYDLVVASHVLHATDDLDQSLHNIRKLLKPDGKLLLFETTRPEVIPIGFAFGLLKGWWSPVDHEQRSPHSPCLTVVQWDEWLRRAGFSGVDVEIPGQEEPMCQCSSIIISSAAIPVVSRTAEASLQIALVVDEEVEAQRTLAKLLESQIPKCLGALCETFTLTRLAEADIPSSSVTIFLKEVDTMFLDDLSEVDYRDLQSILVQAKDIIWITRGDSSDRVEPRHHLAVGLGRALMSEDSSRKFVTISLNGQDGRTENLVNVICEILQRVVDLQVESMEDNYIATEGTLQICRVSENVDMDTKVARAILPRQTVECKLTTNTLVQLHLRLPGHLDTLEWMESDDEGYHKTKSPNQHEVVVQVRAIGLTFRDHLVASGQLDESELGTECAGIIQTASGDSGFEVGDRVYLIATSTSSSIVRIAASAVAAIPSHMSFAEAASIPTALWLSYRALVDVARVEKGETILVHRASSCVGQMTVQLAKRLGARVLVTAPSGVARTLLHEHFMVPETDIFDADDGAAVRMIYCRTDGAGVDAVIGPLAEDGHGIAFDFSACLAPFGRLVDLSLLKASDSIQSQPPFRDRASVNISRASINMIDLMRRRPSLAHATFQRAAKMALDLHLSPPQPLYTFGASEVKAAFRQFSAPNMIGKRVIEISPDMSIMANMKSRPRYSFRLDATYVIAGGLGGLGRSFARWMVSRGARNLILLSRTGAQGAAAKNLVAELISQGVCVATPSVDISNLSWLKREINRLEKLMPPIRGCIQATVALRDNLFPNMTYDDWVIGTGSKATGSWNLHATLPSGLDFFVLLASLNGIVGGRAQANYAAGNTFKDALAHHRVSLGEKAISIDLGLMVAEGVVAENEVLLASMRRLGHLMDISQGELLALLDYYCDPALPLLSHDQVQVLVGLETPAAVLAKGIDLHHSIRRPLFRQLFQMSLLSESIGSADITAEQRLEIDRAGALKRAGSNEQATELVTGWFIAKMAQVLGLDVGDIDPDKPLHAYGIDSLVAIDLKNWFAREINAEVQVFLLLGNTPIRQVAMEAAARSACRS